MLYLLYSMLSEKAGKEPTSNRVVLLMMDVYRLAVQVKELFLRAWLFPLHNNIFTI